MMWLGGVPSCRNRDEKRPFWDTNGGKRDIAVPNGCRRPRSTTDACEPFTRARACAPFE